MNPTPPLLKFLSRFAVACAAGAGALALTGLIPWWLKLWQPFTFGPGFIPMAPTTALFLLLLVIACFLRAKTAVSRTGRALETTCLLVVLAGATPLGLQSLLSFSWPIEQWLSRTSETVGQIPVGRMSPLTAGCLVATALALLCGRVRAARWQPLRSLGGWLALAVFAVSGIVTIGYLAGKPFLYGGSTIPMALLTAIVFLLLSTATMLGAGSDAWPLRMFLRPHVVEDGSGPRHTVEWSLLWLFVVLIVGIAVLGLQYLNREQAKARLAAHAQLETIADLKVGQIVQWRKERLADANLVRYTPYATRRALDVLAQPNSANTRLTFTRWLEPLLAGGAYARVLLLDADLNVRLAHPPGSSDALADAVRAPAKQALQTKTVIMTDLHGAPADGHAHLDLLIPLVVRREASTEEVPPAGTTPSPADRSAGLLVLQVNAHDFLFPLIQAWPASTRTAETLLVRREGNEVLYLNELRHLPGTALKLRRPIDDPRLPAAMGLRGEKSVQQGVDYRGVPVVATARPIPDTPWVLVAKVDEAELYAPLRQQALFVVAIALALLLAAALGITVLWRRRNEHFLQAQLAAERELARAGRDWQTTFDAANDAIWTLDSQHRVLRSNRTAERFFHRPCGEMIGQPCWAIVHGTTQPLPECPVLRARKSLQRETMELRLADRVFEVCVDPILDDQGQYAGAVHIVSDITQRKAHEAEIERLNRLYATLSQVNQAVVRVKSREELAAEVSRVAVAFGGFKLAWVGQHHAETGTLTPVGSAGEPRAFVHDLRHSTADDAGHRCFCVPVIRENRPCVANNLAALREMHDQASAIIPAGIQAAAVIPIRVRGAVWGVFGVYSGEPDVFLEKEIALLEEAAMDVGYAIEHLDTEARRQAAETALRESEAQFKCFFEHSNVGKSITRPSGEVQVNQAFADLLGYSPAELENRTWQEVTHPEDVASTQQVVDALLAGERDSARFTKRYLHKNGSVVWADVSTTLRRDEAGLPLYFMTTVMDITARQKAEAAQARLLHILESSLNEIYVFKADNLRFEYVNLGALRNLGYTLEALRQMTPLDLKPEFDRAKFDQIIEPLLRREKPLQLFETVHRRADGSRYPVEVRLQLFEHEGDRVFLAVIQDLTERKRLEQERQAMEAQLRQQQKLESIGTLASGVAHEINNPITGIMNYAQLIQDRLPADSPLTEFTGEIMHETQRVAGIVRNLLTFARNEKQSHSPARIADIVEGTLSLIRTVIRHDQITLMVNVPEDLPQLKCRSQQIQQVLMNLMTNARDALNERYPGHDPDKVLNLEASLFEQAGRRWIRVTVEDHGTGISPEVRERMFDPFFTTKPRDKGTGLGLAISHGIVKEHHGRLTVESEPGRFTRMHLELPVDNGWNV